MAATTRCVPSYNREILQKYNCKLAENIDAKIILPYLRDVIDSYQADIVYAEQNCFKQNEKLLSFISKAGPNGFTHFMKALEVSYPHLANQIRQELRIGGDQKTSVCSVRPNSGGKGPDVLKKHQDKVLNTNKYTLRRDIPVRQLEREILLKYRMKLHKMDANKIVPLCDSLRDSYVSDSITAEKTQFQKSEKLLDTLVKLGPQAFEEFINALSHVDPELGLPILEELKNHHLLTTV